MNGLLHLYRSSIGKKVIMGITGIIGFGFVLGHMAGNLQFFLGPDKLDEYGRLLRNTHGLLWVARGALVAAIVVHIIMAYQLWLMSRKARPVDYRKWTPDASGYASRTMRWTGPIVGFFVFYHILDFTIGRTNPDFREGEVTHNVVASFSHPLIAASYIVAMILLGLHLRHGIWSMFQSIGLNDPRWDSLLRIVSVVATVVIIFGFISIPLAVIAGYRP